MAASCTKKPGFSGLLCKLSRTQQTSKMRASAIFTVVWMLAVVCGTLQGVTWGASLSQEALAGS